MINFEHGMLVLNGIMTGEDVNAINQYSHYVRIQEREDTIRFLEELLAEPSGINLKGAINKLKEHYGSLN
jgi:hypothetical protein